MHIKSIEPQHPGVQPLIIESDLYMASLYPSESNHMESIQALALPNIFFIGGFVDDLLVACGAVKILDGDGTYGEIKRVFVLRDYRGRGLSKMIMEHLESDLKACGINIARLETGIKQPEALGLYRKLAYVERGPFGSYKSDPLSVFMEKRL
jgi:putative acetyltransferase